MNISVVIPTFNRTKQLLNAIESVQKQSYQAKEIIVIDDGSATALEKNIIEQYGIDYVYQSNQGVASARNQGIKKAQYEWLAFLDSDDIWLPNKLLNHVQQHQSKPTLLASFTNETWNRNGKIIQQKKHQQKEQPTFLNSLKDCKIGASTFFCHQDIFQKVGYFDERLKVCEDYDMWLRILKEEVIEYIDQKLSIKYAGHENQLSFTTPLIDTYRIQALEKHLKSEYKTEVLKELVYKINIVLNGAKKFNQTKRVTVYENKLQEVLDLLH